MNDKSVTQRDQNLPAIVSRIADDVKDLAKEHLELARKELGQDLKTSGVDASVVMLGGVVTAIGLALVCLAAVIALTPWIPTLWVRVLITAVVYTLIGTMLVGMFAKRLRRDAPDLERSERQARTTMRTIQQKV